MVVEALKTTSTLESTICSSIQKFVKLENFISDFLI